MSNRAILVVLIFASFAICYHQESIFIKFLIEGIFSKANPLVPFSMEDLNELLRPNDTECGGRIIKLLKENMKDPLFRPFVEFSGKGLNNYGNFPACQKSDNMTYFVLNIMAPPYPLPVGTVGICFPSICTGITLANSLQNYINKAISLYSTNKLVIIAADQKMSNFFLNQTSNGYYICIYLFTIYFLIVIVATMRKYLILWFSDKKTNHKESKLLVILDCFSLKENIEGVMKNENRIDAKLNVFQFVRSIGIFWVVVGHTFLMLVIYPTKNPMEIMMEVIGNKGMALLRSATLSVDMFLVLGGFLSTFAVISVFEKEQNRTFKNILLIYFNRYFRLFPLMIVAWALSSYLFPTVANGISTTSVMLYQQFCTSRFWQTFLYIDNYFTNMPLFCNSWIWYLFVDMQLFIITPLIVIPALKNIFLGIFILIILSLASLGYQIYIFQTDGMSASILLVHPDWNPHYYQQPYTRCIPYFIGIFFCYLYSQFKGKKQFQSSILIFINQLFKHRLFRYIASLSGISVMIFIIFAQNFFDHSITPIPQYQSTLFLTFSRVLFGLAMICTIYPAMVNFSRPLFSLFGHPLFNVMGKITFGVYMFHLMILNYIGSISMNEINYSFYPLMVKSISIFVFTYIFSFALTVIFESPVVQLLKLLTSGLKGVPQTEVKPKLKQN